MNKSGLFKGAHCIVRLKIQKRWEFIQDRRGVEAQQVDTTTMNLETIDQYTKYKFQFVYVS